jgi:hypothetical protein
MSEPQAVISVLLLIPILALFAAVRGANTVLERKIDRLTVKLDLLLKANNIETEPPLKAEIRQAIADGNKIRAIKLLRQDSKLTLREAKDAIDNWKG